MMIRKNNVARVACALGKLAPHCDTRPFSGLVLSTIIFTKYISIEAVEMDNREIPASKYFFLITNINISIKNRF